MYFYSSCCTQHLITGVFIPLCCSHYSLSVQSSEHHLFILQIPSIHSYGRPTHNLYVKDTALCFSLAGKINYSVDGFRTNGLSFERRAGKYKTDSILHVLHKLNFRWSKDLNVGKKIKPQY